jgi:hypothetical protein
MYCWLETIQFLLVEIITVIEDVLSKVALLVLVSATALQVIIEHRTF